MNERMPSNRRDFLKASAALGAVACVPAVVGSAVAAQQTQPLSASASSSMALPVITQRRTLG